MAQFLNQKQIPFRRLKDFLIEASLRTSKMPYFHGYLSNGNSLQPLFPAIGFLKNAA